MLHPRIWETNAAIALALDAVRGYAGDDPRVQHARDALRIAERIEDERDTEPNFGLEPEAQRALAELRKSTA